MLIHHFHVLAACLGVCVAGYEVADVRKVSPDNKGDYPGGLTLSVFAPKSTKSFPVIWFATGFGGTVHISEYHSLIQRIVAKGYIVAGLYHAIPHWPQYLRDGHYMHRIMKWGQHNLSIWMANQKLTAVPDFNRCAVMGQSSGNHIAGQAITDGCSSAKAFVMIDPVDGLDPFRVVKTEDLIKPGDKVKFDIPALLIDNGLDPLTVGHLFPPCAPASVSNDHFYNAWRGPIWNINATAYGHTDCADILHSGDLCPTNPHSDKDLYKDMLAHAIDVFLGGLFNDSPEQLSLLEDPSHWKVDVVLKHDLKGKSHSGIRAGCANIASPRDVLV